MTGLPKRKRIRLKGYDYSQNGAYFITICTENRMKLFGEIESVGVGQGLCSCRLTPIGHIIEREWYALTDRYPHITLCDFVVMPNHVHGIVRIDNGKWQRQDQEQQEQGRQEQSPCPTNPTLGDIVCTYKSIATKLCNQMDAVVGRKI